MNDLTPLILDLFVPIDIQYDNDGNQLGYDKTSSGQANEIDSNGYD